MASSIHDILAQPNPKLDSRSVSRGRNTSNPDWIPVTEWTPWVDFTYQALLSMYQKVLTARWRDPWSIDMVSDFDRHIRDERGMDYFLAKYIWPPVNGALEQTNSMPDWGKDLLYVGPGSWCHGAGPPDWGLASSCKMEQGKLRNLLPGDTKLSTKWRPDMVSSQKAVERYQWTLPLSQVITYAAQSARRYGFIVTDEALVVLRFTKQRIGHGLATTRPRRAMEPRTYKPFTPSETDPSSLSESAPPDSPKSQSYMDNDFADALDSEFLPPEYAVIPMAAHGNGKLTVKLSMFCLCLMAGGDFGSMGYGYPPLDSWRRMDGQSFIHNTSALVAERLPKNATLFDVDGQELENAN